MFSEMHDFTNFKMHKLGRRLSNTRATEEYFWVDVNHTYKVFTYWKYNMDIV
uniref:Uncharacterized protein n=1 Tax=Daucus carota subsp. sativus TaxID=79200 RepID=A0A166DMQ7_DAUCS